MDWKYCDNNIGLISDAGCPGIADPGADLISIAHEMKVKVKPLVGPSSIFLALMASGMNGQNFMFNGYLSIDKKERKEQIKLLEKEFELNKTENIIKFIKYNFKKYSLDNIFLIAEHSNSERLQTSAYFTRKDIAYSVIKDLPELKKKKKIRIFSSHNKF